jgi:DNA-binding NtrC family response regulator
MESVRVLLVDDEDDFRTTLANRLRKRKMEVAEAESGRSAINLLKQGIFDVVVLDVRMPGMDGIETLKEIKRIDPPMEVIMLTGHASVESGIEGMRLGAFDYLMKPCDINDLINKIMDAYQRLLLQKEST